VSDPPPDEPKPDEDQPVRKKPDPKKPDENKPGEPRPDEPNLISRARAGSETAAQEIFDAYVEKLMVHARRRIGNRMNSRVDAEDVVQSVFRTFFTRLKNDQFQIADQDDLMKLLVRITVHKTLRQIAFHRAAKRNPGQETGHGDNAHERLLQVMDEEPTPETVVAVLDQFEHFLRQFPAQDRQILELKLQGYSTEEIAEKLGTYDRKVRRVLERVRDSAEGMQSEK
jgi:RNA polymerase sigma-70 factor (ECF subfamily)